jgi:DNA excision repair protein ERCC-6
VDLQAEPTSSGRRRNETQRDFLIRTGKITPFAKLPGPSVVRTGSTLQDVLLNAEEDLPSEQLEQEDIEPEEPLSHRNLLQPGFADNVPSATTSDQEEQSDRPTKRRRLEELSESRANEATDKRTKTQKRKAGTKRDGQSSEGSDDSTFKPEVDHGLSPIDDSEIQSSGSEDDEYMQSTPAPKRKRNGGKEKVAKHFSEEEDLTHIDDGNEKIYQARLQSWITRRSNARRKAEASRVTTDDGVTRSQDTNEVGAEHVEERHANSCPQSNEDEWHMPHPTVPDTIFENGYRIPGDIYPLLFDYQKTGVKWLWELYSHQVGGIVGDEMGLGKTIQAISFLAGLHYSKKITKPIIVVAPATVMKQWVNEFHTWWPAFRVSILHSSGSGMIDIGRESQREAELSARMFDPSRRKPLTKAQKAAKRIVDNVVQSGHVLVTTYSGLQTYSELLLKVDWEYAVLDEGHKIRNPNTAITLHCKELRTANRIILSGTPMQNNLMELWSLFDFVFPLKLGTLPDFRQQFELPIREGGYANASNLQVQTAIKCAETLKDAISPYLLQRYKEDVASDLPKKTERSLFCYLTPLQRDAYENFLSSDDMKSILNRKRQVLYGVDMLRKICNHPDLQEHRVLSVKAGYDYGNRAKSGKMGTVRELLTAWRKLGHKTLLFAQHRIMLDILEKDIKSMEGINYRRMDGTTPIATRQTMVDEFNNNPDAHVFLLTTKVGGLGINLTGANRVIIYDPDWNPSTDIQARERAWRLGQKREVEIFRLLTKGTIEEKILHRQLFKQALTDKILRDPKQRQTFQIKDLHDLFTLGGENEEDTETGRLFQGAEVKFMKPTPGSKHDLIPWGGAPPRPEATDEEQIIGNLPGVAYVADDAAGEQPQEHKDSEARIMESIFARSGVHSALDHDHVVNGQRTLTADPHIIEREARRVATEAARGLQKAQELARSVPVGTATWTGQFGSAGRPASGAGRGRGGPASGGVLANLRQRQGTNGAVNTNGGVNDRSTVYMKMIRAYITRMGGKVYTRMLIDQFRRQCETDEKAEIFQAVLKTIAVVEKGSSGRGAWTLKDEYK